MKWLEYTKKKNGRTGVVKMSKYTTQGCSLLIKAILTDAIEEVIKTDRKKLHSVLYQ